MVLIRTIIKECTGSAELHKAFEYKKTALIGANGMLATMVREKAPKNYEFHCLDLPEFDITDQTKVLSLIKELRPEIIINCAAYTNVEKAEVEADLANKINGHAVGQLGQIARAANIPVLHISTDFVFDGAKRKPYLETDTTNPVSAYGRSKLLGEKLIAESGCNNCIMRVQWTYGKNGVNFISKILISNHIQLKHILVKENGKG